MKSFYSLDSVGSDTGRLPTECPDFVGAPLYTRARVAVYEAPLSAPRVEEVEACPAGEYIEAISTRVYELARSQGGTIPYTVVREVAENLIHAAFLEPVVSVLDNGNTIRFADQGPGITDKDRAVLPGYTTATCSMKRHIRGVGSGLPIVRDFLDVSGGSLSIEDNLGCGAVVTISGSRGAKVAPSVSVVQHTPPSNRPGQTAAFESDALTSPLRRGLTNRQKQVLALVMESGSAGPSLVSRELGVGISTAYRDLASLEDMGLITSDGGKRALTDEGLLYLDEMIAGS